MIQTGVNVNMDIKIRVDQIFNEIVEIRRNLHANPELSEYETETAQTISKILSSYKIDHKCGFAGNGIIGIIEGKGKIRNNQKFLTVGIRADIDALPVDEIADIPFKSTKPGIMHACGHDIHTAILLGTAKILKEMEDDIPGTVKLFFEPAEETIGGAEKMIEEGCLENPKVDAVIGLHITPDIEAGKIQLRRGKMNAASTEFEITIEGVEAHGAHPEGGIDSIFVASNLVCVLQSIITRNMAPTNPGIITIGKISGGSKNNVIAKETTLYGIIRAMDKNNKEFIENRVKKLSEDLASGFNAKAKVIFQNGYPALINDDEIGDIIESTAAKILKKENVCFLEEPSLGSDDFAYFSEKTKSFYFNIGCLKKDSKNHQSLHSGFLVPDEECIRTGMLMEIFGVLEILNS